MFFLHLSSQLNTIDVSRCSPTHLEDHGPLGKMCLFLQKKRESPWSPCFVHFHVGKLECNPFHAAGGLMWVCRWNDIHVVRGVRGSGDRNLHRKARCFRVGDSNSITLVVRHLFLVANIVTTSKAPVTTSDALVVFSNLVSPDAWNFLLASLAANIPRQRRKQTPLLLGKMDDHQ